MSLDPESIMAMLNIGAVTGKITLRKAEIMDCVEQIRFTNTIVPAYTNDPFRKIKRAVRIVFELQ
jgi:hypothetical protein